MARNDGEAWKARVRDAVLQGLEDVACAGTCTVGVIETRGEGAALASIANAALEAGFVVASASIAEHGLHDLDAVVRAFALDLRAPGAPKKGIVAALDAFVATHKRRAEERFEEAASAEHLGGELAVLAGSYVAAASGRGEARRLHAWLRGDDPARTDDAQLRTLSHRTAKAALADLTRLSRALGHRGTLLFARDAEALVDLSPARRDVAYTVLRELVDNADGGRGMVATKLLVSATSALFDRAGSIQTHAALASRLSTDGAPIPTPHAARVSLEPLEGVELARAPRVEEREARQQKNLRALLRLAQGLPPLEPNGDLAVGMEAVDARVDQLFEHADNDGSVFAVLSGDYGAGKTHHLLHLEARALADKRPVFWLSVERLDEDLGNPQRHLRRLLEGATLPFPGSPSPLDRLAHWTKSDASTRKLASALRAVADADIEASSAAERALRGSDDALDVDAARATLGALDLVDKPSHATYRKDAYSRLHLWLELLARIDGCHGPLVLLDEAENLYRLGVSRAERRTALRSLAFYCGGALARACVVLAVTPATLEELREEAGELLDAIEEQVTLLPQEDVSMLRRRLLRARPIEVTKLSRADLATLAARARSIFERVHGKVADAGWDAWLKRAIAESETPRDLLRKVTTRLERIVWGEV